MSFPVGRCVAISLFLSLLLLLDPARPAFSQEPLREDLPVFNITTVNGQGEEMKVFPPRSAVFYEIRFALALSASERYATTITLILDNDGTISEELLFQGVLKEGNYRLTVPSKQAVIAGGEARYRIIFRTRFFPKKFTGESHLIYRAVEGSYSIDGGKALR